VERLVVTTAIAIGTDRVEPQSPAPSGHDDHDEKLHRIHRTDMTESLHDRSLEAAPAA
jgi:hypothetical protein